MPPIDPIQRPAAARLLVGDRDGHITPLACDRDSSASCRPGDLVIANDAATLPASLAGTHVPTGRPIEVRLAGRDSLATRSPAFRRCCSAPGDFRTRTEDRPLPPAVHPGDQLVLGPLRARIGGLHHHPRLVALRIRRRA